jgi:CRISPR/Cas system-associated protein Csm6
LLHKLFELTFSIVLAKLISSFLSQRKFRVSVIDVKYFDIIFDKRIAWRLYVEMIETKAFRTFIRIYSLFRSERLSANSKLTLHKALLRSVMTYACPACELVVETYLIKL